MATPKQEKLIKLILENLGNKGNTRTLGELILEAGYEESMAKNPYQILGSETIQEGLSDVVDELKKKRKKALSFLTDKKLSEEKAKDLTDIIDKLTKNIQLLSGGMTENIGVIPIYGGISRHESNPKDIQPNEKDTRSERGNVSEQDSEHTDLVH